MRSFLCAAMLFATTAAGAQTIRPEAMRGTMRFLASDLLEGRGTGSRGYQIAAEYVASQFESLGLAPGANGSYFQAVPFVQTKEDAQQTTVRVGDRVLRGEADYVAHPDPVRTIADVDAPVVFAGYGVTAPSRGYDDYKGIDARGKIVAIVTGGPRAFP